MQGSKLILFPELWSSGYDLKNGMSHSHANLAILGELSRMAQEHQIFIGGSLLEDLSGKLYNTFYLLPPDGGQGAKYQKLHLFRLMHENRWLQPGKETCLVDLSWGKAGLAVCYDLRFPELFRTYALSGAQIVLLVSEWPLSRIAHWKTLLQARAIENQMYLAAVNCVGSAGKETFGGSSAVIDPWGELLVQGSEHEEQLLITELDLAQVEQVRQKIPVFDDRRPDIYS